MLARRSSAGSSSDEAAVVAAAEAEDRAELLREERHRLELAKADSNAFGWFFERYDVPVLLFLRSLVPNHDDAQELHDKAFLRALLSLGSYRWQGTLYGAYLHRIAANEAASYWRSRHRRQFVDADGAVPLLDRRADALDGLVSEEEARRLHRAIATLNEADQSVLTMYYWEGLNTAQIAVELEEPPGTIQARLKRARDKLERALTKKARREIPAVVPEDRIKWLATVLQRRLGLRRDLG